MHQVSATTYVAHPTLSDDSPSDDGRLLRALRSGDSRMWQEWISRWTPRLYTYTRYNVHSEEDCKELLHAVFSLFTRTVMQSSQTFNLSILLLSALHRAVLQYQQKRGAPKPSVYQNALWLDPEQKKFVTLLQELTPDIRQVTLLRYTIDLSLTELEMVTGHSVNTLNEMLMTASSLLKNL